MPITTTCPECRRDLRVPDHLLGTLVRCPHCRTEFTAQQEGTQPSPPPVETPAPPEPDPFADTLPRPETPPADAFRAPETEPPAEGGAPGPRALPPRPNLDDDEDDENLEERYEESRRRRIEQESYESARQRVLPPAICLMVVAGACLAIDAFSIVLTIVQVAMMPAMGPPPPGAGPFGGMEFMLGYKAVSIGTSILWGALVLFGAIRLKQLRSFGMVMVGCIFAMLPCFNACCLLGLPFGIWVLVVIHDEHVRRHFTA